MNKQNINSVKAVMQTLNVSLDDLIENSELMSLLRARILNGTLSKSIVQQLLNEMPELKT